MGPGQAPVNAQPSPKNVPPTNAGLIFTEMIAGQATFPGMKDAYDQLDVL